MYTDQSKPTSSTKGDLVKIVQHYLPLKASRRALKADCPFHSDQSSSLMVLPERNLFKCFGCGQEGGAVEFIMLIEKKSRPDAEKHLASTTFD